MQVFVFFLSLIHTRRSQQKIKSVKETWEIVESDNFDEESNSFIRKNWRHLGKKALGIGILVELTNISRQFNHRGSAWLFFLRENR